LYIENAAEKPLGRREEGEFGEGKVEYTTNIEGNLLNQARMLYM
jgi:hypothetical protein